MSDTADAPASEIDIKALMLGAEAVIFDVDGTLVDSVDYHAEAWRQAFAHFGLRLEFDAIRAQIGKGDDQLMPMFLDKDTLETHGEEIEAFRSELFKREYLLRVQGFPRVRELFDILRAAGVATALGSSAKQAELEVYKRAAGIGDLALVETTSDDAEKSKPYPDIFDVALESLKLPAEKVLVVGDTPHDVEAANRANLRTIGVLCGGFSKASLVEAGAVAVFANPADLVATLV